MTQPLPGPGSDRFTFSERVHRYLSGGATPEECDQLQAELNDPAKRQEFLAATVLEGRLRQTADAAVASEPVRAGRAGIGAGAGIAAGLLAAAALLIGVALNTPSTPTNPAAPATRTVSLQANGDSLGGWSIAAAGSRNGANGVIIEQPANQPILASFVTFVRSPPAHR